MLNQKLKLYASRYLEGNNETCPTGRILPVAGTPMDFTSGKPLGRDIDTGFSQTTMVGGGFDHCFVIDRDRGSSQSLCAWATSEKKRHQHEDVHHSAGHPALHGQFLQDCPTPGKGGVPLQKYGGFALETQHFPCSPSHPGFPPPSSGRARSSAPTPRCAFSPDASVDAFEKENGMAARSGGHFVFRVIFLSFAQKASSLHGQGAKKLWFHHRAEKDATRIQPHKMGGT